MGTEYSEYEVVVGNVGMVHSGGNKKEARKVFNEYKKISKSGLGRAGGEFVALFHDGEQLDIYEGTLED